MHCISIEGGADSEHFAASLYDPGTVVTCELSFFAGGRLNLFNVLPNRLNPSV